MLKLFCLLITIQYFECVDLSDSRSKSEITTKDLALIYKHFFQNNANIVQHHLQNKPILTNILHGSNSHQNHQFQNKKK